VEDSLRFVFGADVPMADVEETLHLAMFAVEGLAGRVRVRLDVAYQIDPVVRAITLGVTSSVGRTVARVFAGFLHRAFGEAAFHVRHTGSPLPEEVTA
jgi:hypothetical protein